MQSTKQTIPKEIRGIIVYKVGDGLSWNKQYFPSYDKLQTHLREVCGVIERSIVKPKFHGIQK